MRSLVRVVSSSESAARDAAAIAGGIPSRALMQRAGAAAAAEIALRYRDRIGGEILILAGPGNNGGDAWVVARALDTAGARVRVVEPVPCKAPDALAERELAMQQLAARSVETALPADSLYRGEALIIDGLLGTGAKGAPTGALGTVIEQLSSLSTRDAAIVALDVPSGLDATTGDTAGAVAPADLTLSFGTIKRGHLVNREVCGSIVVLDIGLGGHASLGDGAPQLVDEPWVATQVPRIPASAHKGVRKKLAIVGGAVGMVGATILAAALGDPQRHRDGEAHRRRRQPPRRAGERAVRARRRLAHRRCRRRPRDHRLGRRRRHRPGPRPHRRQPRAARSRAPPLDRPHRPRRRRAHAVRGRSGKARPASARPPGDHHAAPGGVRPAVRRAGRRRAPPSGSRSAASSPQRSARACCSRACPRSSRRPTASGS